MREVAAKAEVSQATVSRVLSGNPDVSPEMAERVKLAASELNYRLNSAARELRTGRSLTIGLVLPDIQNPFFTSVISGIEEVLQPAGYSLFLANSDEQSARERLHIEKLRSDGVAGLLLVPSAEPRATYRELLGVPVVALSRTHRNLKVDSVTVDNAAGVSAGVSHLIRLGHREIAFINGPPTRSTAQDRLAGYKEALRQAGIAMDQSWISCGDFRQQGGFDAMKALLARPHRPSAVLAGNNLMTLGALEAIHDAGCDIPADIAIVGFDDMPWATSLQPPLTAIAQPTHEIGRASARLLLDRIADPSKPVCRVILETELRVRASCGANYRSAPESEESDSVGALSTL